jgi:hypothetical protein
MLARALAMPGGLASNDSSMRATTWIVGLAGMLEIGDERERARAKHRRALAGLGLLSRCDKASLAWNGQERAHAGAPT